MAGKRKRYFLITVLLVNLFFIKAPVSQAIQDELGLELEINGPLRIRFGARPVLTVVDIRLSHPGRGERPLATAGKLEIKPRLRALFRGQFHFRTLQGSAIGFDYCQPWPPAPGDTESGDTRGHHRPWSSTTCSSPASSRGVRILRMHPPWFLKVSI